MKSLLIKDLYAISSQLKIVFIMLVLFLFFDHSTTLLMCSLGGAMIPVTAFSYDEQSHFTKLAKALPYSDISITLSKYILGYITLGFTTFLATLVITFLNKSFDFNMTMTSILLGFLIISIYLPVVFKFGWEKGRFFIFGIIFVTSTASGYLINPAKSFWIFEIIPITPMGVFLFVVAISFFSIFISVRINEKKRVN